MAKRSFLIFALVALTLASAAAALGQQANIAKPEVFRLSAEVETKLPCHFIDMSKPLDAR